jgi:hypothetical protein
MSNQNSFAEVAAIQILAHEILYEIGMPVCGDVPAARLWRKVFALPLEAG